MFNQLVYALINLVIAQISSLRDRLCSLHSHHHHHHHHAHKVGGGVAGEGPSASGWSDGVPRPLPQPSSPGEDEPVNVERDSAEEDGDSRTDLNQNKMQGQPGPQGPQPPGDAHAEALGPGRAEGGAGSPDPFSSWSTEEREKLLLCAAKIFQIQFPLYTAYKHNTHPTIEVNTHTRTHKYRPAACPPSAAAPKSTHSIDNKLESFLLLMLRPSSCA